MFESFSNYKDKADITSSEMLMRLLPSVCSQYDGASMQSCKLCKHNRLVVKKEYHKQRSVQPA